MRSWEEIQKLFGESPKTNHRREYNGIKVDISNKDTIDIMPKGTNVWMKDNKERIEKIVRNLEENNDTFMEIPKYLWIEWLNESFED